MESKLLKISDIFDELGIEHTNQSEQIFSLAFAYLLFIPAESEIATSFVTFKKLSDDIIHVSSTIDRDIIFDELVGKQVVRLPV